MRRVTISDVADLARVLKATVSYVINHTRFVEEETRSRLVQAIKNLGYHPSAFPLCWVGRCLDVAGFNQRTRPCRNSHPPGLRARPASILLFEP